MDAGKKREAQLVIVTGLALLSIILEVRGWQYSKYLLYTAIIIGILCLLSDYIGTIIVKGWFKLAEGLGWINSRILLSIIFFFILFPIALVSRLFGKSNIQLKKPSGSVYTERNHTYTKEDLENIW